MSAPAPLQQDAGGRARQSALSLLFPSTLLVSALLDKAFDWSFSLFIFVTIFFPSSSVYGLNFKYPIYVVLLPLAVVALFRRGKLTASGLAALLAVPGIFLLWILVGASHEVFMAALLRQYTDILLVLMLCWLASVYCNGQQTRRLKFIRLVLYSEFATAVFKIGLIAFALLRGIPIVDMVLWLDKVFDVELMSMDLGALLGRVQFVSDGLIPICIFVLLRYRHRLRIGNVVASLIILVLVVSVLFSFSRYFWGFTVIGLVLGLALGQRDRFQALLVSVLALSVLASLPVLVPLYELRFSTQLTGASDQDRTQQIPALEHFFVDAPFFGNGLGSYTPENVRAPDPVMRYTYEVQLLALAAQIGIFGMGVFVLLGAFYFRKLWWRSTLRLSDRLSLLLLLAIWIAAGLANPFLLSTMAAINYATLATLAGYAGSNARRQAALPAPGALLSAPEL